jgi:hypothetical protein
MLRGAAPGERRDGRQKGTPNKLSIGRVKATVATAAPEFDSLDQLRLIAKHFLDQATAEGKKKNANIRRINDCLDRAARVLRDIAPYEHPKLSAVKLGSDPDAPLNLSGLSDDELAHFRRLMIKIGAATGVGHDHSSRRQNARPPVFGREVGTLR